MDNSTCKSLHILSEVKPEPDTKEDYETKRIPHDDISMDSPLKPEKLEQNSPLNQELVLGFSTEFDSDKSLQKSYDEKRIGSFETVPGCNKIVTNHIESMLKVENIEEIDDDEQMHDVNPADWNIKSEEVDMKEDKLELYKTRTQKALSSEELDRAVEQVLKKLAEERTIEADQRQECSSVIHNGLDDSDSEAEEEIIKTDYYSSDSEQSADELEVTDEYRQEAEDYRFFVGRDNENIWMSQPVSSRKVKEEKTIKILPGPKSTAKCTPKEIDAFNLLITDEMIDDIVANTNIYIENKRKNVNYSRVRDCRSTSKIEIRALLGALILISIKKGSRTNCLELWDADGTGLMILRALFSYKRFLFLLRSLRFDNILTRNERRQNDKLAPIRNFHETFIRNCIAHYNPSKFVTIDEMLHSFRGRCSFVQYTPNKPAKYGIKMYALCDAKTFYTLNFEIYCGEQLPGPYATSNKADDIVKRLVVPMENSQINLTTDCYYSSYSLAEYLLTKRLTFLGTMKKNMKEIPIEFLPNKTRVKNSRIFGFQDEACLVSTVPKKNKSIIFLSTMHSTAEVDANTNKSLVNLDYDATKGAVDTVDQMCAAYSTARITRRWALAVFFRHLDIAGINAYVIFKLNNFKSNDRRRIFLKNLSFSLMEEYLKERALIQTLPKEIYHFLSKYRNEEVVKFPVKRGICFVCGTHKNNRTKSVCQNCGKNVCKKHSTIIIVVNCQTCNEKQMEVG